MPHYIKTGYWALEKNGYKGWLNLEDIIPGGSGGASSVTKAEIDVLISSNALVPGSIYIISGVDVPLYGGTTVILKAATTNKLELAGHGIFYNPKYLNSQLTPNNGYGIWSNYITLTFSNVVGTFNNDESITANNGATAIYLAEGFLEWVSGDWSAATSVTGSYYGGTANVTGGVSPSYAIGQDVIWGGKHWTNISGNVGTAVDKYTLSSADWTAIPFNDVDYNVEVDIIHYDYIHDMIVRRKDRYDNDVDGNFQVFDEFASPNGYSFGNPIKDFQWGNYPDDWNTNDYWYLGVQSNYVKDSYLDCINFIGEYLWNNTLIEKSYMNNNKTDTRVLIENNNLKGASFIDENVCNFGGFYNLELSDYSRVSNNFLSLGQIGESRLKKSRIDSNAISGRVFIGNIRYCDLDDDSFIENNKLIAGCDISSVKLTNQSSIRDNIVDATSGGSGINRVVLNIASKIAGNNLSGANISFVSLNSSTLLQNTILGLGSSIQDLVLNNVVFDFSSSGTLTGKSIGNITGQYANTSAFNISAATIIYGNYPKQLLKNSAGTTRLGYYNNSDVFTIVNVNA